HRGAAEVRDGGCPAYAANAPVQAIDEAEYGRHIDEVDQNLDGQRDPHPLTAQQPAQDDVVDQRERGGPYPAVGIQARLFGGFVGGAEQGEPAIDQRALQQQDQHADGTGDQHAASNRQQDGFVVARAKVLRHHASGSHAQETKTPEQQIEEQAAQGNPRQMVGAGQVPGHSGVNSGHQRLGQVGQNDGNGQEQHVAVADGGRGNGAHEVDPGSV